MNISETIHPQIIENSTDAETEVTEVITEPEGPPVDPNEFLVDYEDSTTEIDLTHHRLKTLPSLARFKSLLKLGFRQNLFTKFSLEKEAVSALSKTLRELDLYDNRLSEISSDISQFYELTHLDLSFNLIKTIGDTFSSLTNLTALYLCQNKITEIDGLSALKNLRILELGANRIKTIENLENLKNLQEIYLGKNKISSLKGLESLVNLRLISIQSNRITEINHIENLVNLEEIYLSHNGISKIQNFEHNKKLKVIDLGNNRIQTLENLKSLEGLSELWINHNSISSYEDVEKELGTMPFLTCVYFEGNPLANDTQYRLKIKMRLKNLKQLDATFLR